MTSVIELDAGMTRISVSDALAEIGRVALLPPNFDVYVETFVGTDGAEVAVADSKLYLVENKQGSSVPLEWLERNFDVFCKKTGTTPRNTFHPFILDYDGGVTHSYSMYNISIEEFRRFAEAYNVAVTIGTPVVRKHQSIARVKGGRPRSVEPKLVILGKLIEIMLNGTDCKATALPGSAADLLDACQRIEKGKTRKTSVFGGATSNTFITWLNSAGYGMKIGRTRAAERNYWTSILPKVMEKVPHDIFL